MSFIFVSKKLVEENKEKLNEKIGIWETISYELKKKADELMTKGPWSVTFTKSPAISGDIHDYFSEGPYWWPDPQSLNGPYIRKDGQHNPNRFKDHNNGMKNVINSVLYLGMAGYYLNEEEYIKKAVHILKVWFINAETKMNPHLEYAQAIRGICDGRGIGIIDTHTFVSLIHGLGFIEEFGGYNNVILDMKSWFKQYLNWLIKSEKGLKERNQGNNHSTWYNTQVAAYSAFIEDEKTLYDCFNFYKKVLIPNQMDQDGNFPDEIKRTNSMNYFIFNLNAYALLCEIAYNKGVDLWNYKTKDGRGIEKAINFLSPYLDNLFLWPYKQIMGKIPDENYALHMASLRLCIKECESINKKLGENKYLIRHNSPLGPLALLQY